MSVRPPHPFCWLAFGAVLFATVATAPAQEQKVVGYPKRDLLSPFRNPNDVYLPPEELFRNLRIMQDLAEAGRAEKRFDETGREVVADPAWEKAYQEVWKIGLDAAYLANIIRLQRHAPDRLTAFYAGFYLANSHQVLQIIEHIPGEPDRNIRQAMFPRAAEFVQKQLGRKFGELSEDEKKAIRELLPQPGSPAAKAQGLVRPPQDEDTLHELRVVPFLQMLDLDDPLDQAQALWFLTQVFRVRLDLALVWLEPSLPRLRQLLTSPDKRVRDQAIALFETIGPKDLRRAPSEARDLQDWAEEAARALFPPIRNLNDAILQLHPSKERDTIVEAGVKSLETSAIGDAYTGKNADGQWVRGFRLLRLPDELKPLAIPVESVITTVNGVATPNAELLLRTIREQLALQKHPRRLIVEYVLKGAPHAVEYRIQ